MLSRHRELKMNIECKNVTLGYENRIVAKNVNFSINQGDYLCIVGENGTGKSTLLKGILGLQKLNSGTVCFSGINKNNVI